MKDTKRRFEVFSFFDCDGISRHLEKMAAKGWMIQRLTNFGWIYRRISPKKIKFAVSYYPRASEFDPEPSDDQKTFFDFCAHTGWELACTSAQLQIFYNQRPNPTPIETEPELEVESIHAAAKKGIIVPYLLLLLIAFMQCSFVITGLLGNPISFLADPTKLFTGFCFLILAVLCIGELSCYFLWHKKAEKAALHGEFLKPISTSIFQKILLSLAVIGAVYWIISFILWGNPFQRFAGIAMCIYMTALIILVNALKNFLKGRKASRSLNRTLTILASFILSFSMMGLITLGILKLSSSGFFAKNTEDTYEYNGITWTIHQDPLPLTIEDLMDADTNVYIKERRDSESLLLGQFVMSQYPRFDAMDYTDIPQMEYTIVSVKIPALYHMCKNRLFFEQERLNSIAERRYKAQEAAPWGAAEAYRLYDPQYGYQNDYLLCYNKILVEISFNWEPTKEQMEIAGEKLNPLTI